MVLRNVPSTATFEEQRVEINELAADVEALDAAALKAESDTLQTVTDRGFTTTNPIKIENNAATAFVVEDGSSNEKFVVDSVNGKINVGSSAGGASGIYLFHNNSGATPAITLDGATGSITNKGQLVTESILSSAALNNKGSVQFGTVDAYSIGHMPLNSNLAFSQTHGGSYLFYSDASTVELEIASGGITVDGTATFGGTITHDFNTNYQKGIRMLDNGGHSMLDINGTGANATAFAVYDGSASDYKVQIKHDGSATFDANVDARNINASRPTTNLDVFSGYGGGTLTSQINANGSAQFGVSGGNYVSVDTNGKLLARNSSSSATIVLAANFNGTDNFTVAANGTITSNSGLAAASVNLQSSSTASWFQTGTSLGGSDYVWAVKNSSTNTWHGGLKTSSDLYLGGDITSDPKILLNGSNGSASFDETVTIGSGSAAPDDYGLIAYANANTLSNKSAVYARNLADGRNFTGDNAAGATTFELYASGLGNFGAASNSTGNNGVQIGGNNGSLNIYTDRYNTDCFQIVNTSGSGTNVALKAYGNGDLEIAGIIQTNTKSAGHIELDSTGAFTSPKLKLFSNTGDITTAGAITFTGQTSTAASGSGTSSDAFDHYEEGSWTPTPLGLSNSPTFSNLKGRFVRIGSLVQIQGFIQMASSPTWNNVNDFFMLGPLPFNYNADNAGYFATAGGVTCQNFNFHDNDYNNTGQVNCGIANSSGVSYVCFLVSDNNNTRGTVKNSAISGNDIIEFSLTYRAG